MTNPAGTPPTIDEGPGSRMPLHGDLDLRNAGEIATSLREAIAAADTVQIDISGLTGLDISIAQLLLAARKSAELRGKALDLTGVLAASCHDTLAAAGLLGPDGAPRSTSQAFWLAQSVHESEAAQ